MRPLSTARSYASLSFLLQCAAVTAAYAVSGRLGLYLAFSHGSVTPFWPPSGLAVAALYMLGLRVWPAVWVGALVVNLLVGPSAAVGACIATGNTLEGVAAAYLLTRIIGPSARFDRLREVLALVSIAVGASVIAALVGVTTLSKLGPHIIATRQVALVWWGGDVIGILLVAPLVISWLRTDRSVNRPQHAAEWGAVLLLGALSSVIAFGDGIIRDEGLFHPLAFLSLPFVVWAAIRLGTRGASTLTIVIATIAAGNTDRWSPSIDVARAQVAVLLTFLAIVSMSGLVVSAVVSAHAAAEASLERQHARYKALVQALPDLIVRVTRGGVVLDVHTPAGGLLPTASHTLIGRPVSEVLPLSVVDELSVALAASGHARAEVSWAQGDNDRAVEVRIVPSGDEELTLLCRDVTELRAAESKLLITDRLASIGMLAAGVAHEINNPLTFVGGSLDLVDRFRDSTVPAERAKVVSSLAAAKIGVDRIARIVRDLLRLARPESDESLVDLQATIDLAARMAQREMESRARFVTEIGELPPVRGSEARLGQVILNLLINAAQAMPEGSPESHEIRVVTRESSDGRAVIEVRDDGAGIAPELLPRVFEPFFTTKPAGIGTGLGLPMCQQVLTAMGGEIDIESTVGVGTTVRVTLPAYRA